MDPTWISAEKVRFHESLRNFSKMLELYIMGSTIMLNDNSK